MIFCILWNPGSSLGISPFHIEWDHKLLSAQLCKLLVLWLKLPTMTAPVMVLCLTIQVRMKHGGLWDLLNDIVRIIISIEYNIHIYIHISFRFSKSLSLRALPIELRIVIVSDNLRIKHVAQRYHGAKKSTKTSSLPRVEDDDVPHQNLWCFSHVEQLLQEVMKETKSSKTLDTPVYHTC